MKCVKHYVGIDVSKLSFDVCFQEGDLYKHYQFSNDPSGFKCLVSLFNSPAHYHVVMEASGPYYQSIALYLFEQGTSVSVVNPLVIRRFCQMRLSRAKTDKKDAKMIALYGQAEQPSLWEPDAEYVLELRQMQAALEGYTKSKTAMERQKEAFTHSSSTSKDVLRSLNKTIGNIKKEIDILEAKMEQLAQKYHGDQFKNLQSIPGIGKKTALQLIVATGAFKKFSSAKQLSAYFGLSPRIFESGTSVKGKARITKMGMSRIRAMLCMCSWTAKKCNKACKELYDRLVTKGKSKRLALVAVANKLIKQAFAIATKETTYQTT